MKQAVRRGKEIKEEPFSVPPCLSGETDMNADPAGLDGAWIRAAVARFEGPLTLYAARLTGGVEHSRDAVQETFLRLCRQERGEIEPHLAEWLYTVCRNCALDIRRRERRMTPIAETAAETRRDPTPMPPETLERKEAAGEVLRLLDELPDEQQECLRLKFQHGRSYKEIAAITEKSVTHVGVLIHLGLKALRARVGEGQVRA